MIFVEALAGLCWRKTSIVQDELNKKRAYQNCCVSMSARGKAALEELSTKETTKANFSYCDLDDTLASDTSILLQAHTNISELCFSHNRIGDRGATNIARYLLENDSVTTLHLSYNRIESQGAVEITTAALIHNPTVQQLFIGHNKIGDEGGQFMARALRHNNCLKILCFGPNPTSSITSTEIANSLLMNHCLTELALNSCNVGDEGAKALGAMLKFNTTLAVLSLQGNNINGGSEVILESLSGNCTLRWLDLGNNEVTDTTAARLAAALPSAKSLVILDLSKNKMTQCGLDVLEDVWSKRRHHSEKGSQPAALHLWGNIPMTQKPRLRNAEQIIGTAEEWCAEVPHIQDLPKEFMEEAQNPQHLKRVEKAERLISLTKEQAKEPSAASKE